MLARFTIEGGCIPVTEQARAELLTDYLNILRNYDAETEPVIRNEIHAFRDKTVSKR